MAEAGGRKTLLQGALVNLSLILLSIVYPFVPGEYDRLALPLPLSTTWARESLSSTIHEEIMEASRASANTLSVSGAFRS